MSPKRPPSIMGDAERAAIGAEHRKTPPVGIPVEVDPESTPPPQEPPDITQLPGFEKLAPEMQAPLLELYNSQREHDVALMRMWSSRNVHQDFANLQTAVEVLAERVAPLIDLGVALRAQGQQLHRVVVWMEAQTKRDDRLDKLLDALDKRLDGIEREHAGLNASIVGFGARVDAGFGNSARELAAANSRIDKLESRILVLEGGSAKAVDVKAGDAELERRVASLEETRTGMKGAWWAIAGIATLMAGLVAFVVSQLHH